VPDALWYYARDDEQLGPISTADLQQMVTNGKLAPEDFVWKDGMDEWAPASHFSGLFPELPLAASSTPEVVLYQRTPEPRAARPRALQRSRPRGRASARALTVLQGVLWAMCVLTVLVGSLLFTRAWMNANSPEEELAAGAFYSTFFIGAYVIARCGEKLSTLVLGWILSRRDADNGP